MKEMDVLLEVGRTTVIKQVAVIEGQMIHFIKLISQIKCVKTHDILSDQDASTNIQMQGAVWQRRHHTMQGTSKDKVVQSRVQPRSIELGLTTPEGIGNR